MERNKTTDILAERIGILRARAGESQQELADKIGVKRETVKFWESGDRQIKGADIVKLAKHFNVSTDYLLGFSEAATDDRDLKFVCAYTRLSEDSIKAILEIPEYVGGEDYLHALDLLISHYCVEMASNLWHIKQKCDAARNYLEKPYAPSPNCAPIVAFQEVEKLIEKLEVSSFRFSKDTASIPERLFHADSVLDHLQGRLEEIIQVSGSQRIEDPAEKEAADDGQHTEG